MNIDSQFGERLKIERKRLNYSQQAAADLVGVSREMWGKYERGSKPGADVIKKMSVSGFNVQYLLVGEHTLAVEISVEEIELLDKFRLSPIQAQAAVLNLLDITSKREQKLTSTENVYEAANNHSNLIAAQKRAKYGDDEPIVLDLNNPSLGGKK